MRQPLRAILFVIAALAAAAPSPAFAAQTPIGAGAANGGWVALPYPDTRPVDPKDNKPRPDLEQLYFLPADSPPGALYGVQQLPSAPHAIAASGSRVILLFAPTDGATASSSHRWTTRALTALDQPDPLPPIFDPKGRLEVLPALRTDGSVTGFCGIPGGGAAALISPITDAAGQPIGSGYQLKALIGGDWRDVALPATVDSKTTCRLLPTPEGLSLLLPDASRASRSTLWKAQILNTFDRSGSIIEPVWTKGEISITNTGAPMIVSSGGHIITAMRNFAGETLLTLHLADSATPLATLNDVPDDFAFTRVGDTLSMVYLSDDPKPQILTIAMHTSTGEVLHQGPHVKVMPISTDDLRFLGFILALVLMTALVFVLRPSAASTQVIKLPQGTAMAAPERRLLAGVIDFTLPLLVVVQVWDIGFMQVILAPLQAEQANEFWPFAVTSVAFFAHTVFTERLFGGRTLGKAITGIRVASINGKPLTLWQCVSRNTIKLVCPPLLTMIFVDPRRRHPGDTLAGAIVIAKSKGPEPPTDQGDPDDDGDDGPGRTNEATVADG